MKDGGVVRADGREKIPKPVRVTWEGGRTNFREGEFRHPSCIVLCAEIVNIRMTVDFDIIPCLRHISPIKHVKKPLAFDWHREAVVQEVHEDVSSALIGGSNGKVIDLAHEDNAGVVDDPRVETWFMYRRGEANVTENSVGMFLP